MTAWKLEKQVQKNNNNDFDGAITYIRHADLTGITRIQCIERIAKFTRQAKRKKQVINQLLWWRNWLVLHQLIADGVMRIFQRIDTITESKFLDANSFS